jgi:8-oxo-dGTP pyrophosphatase MutT (NUDIX family)
MIIDKVAWIYIKDKKILSTLSFGKSKYYIPGGKRETGESDEDCLKREIEEELSVQLVDNTIRYFDTFQAQADAQKEGVIVQMRCYFSEYTGEIEPSHEIQSVVWLTYNDRFKSAEVDQEIFQVLFDKGLLM